MSSRPLAERLEGLRFVLCCFQCWRRLGECEAAGEVETENITEKENGSGLWAGGQQLIAKLRTLGGNMLRWCSQAFGSATNIVSLVGLSFSETGVVRSTNAGWRKCSKVGGRWWWFRGFFGLLCWTILKNLRSRYVGNNECAFTYSNSSVTHLQNCSDGLSTSRKGVSCGRPLGLTTELIRCLLLLDTLLLAAAAPIGPLDLAKVEQDDPFISPPTRGPPKKELPPNQMKAGLYGSLFQFAYYFVDIDVGTPGQRQSVIVDTGSSILGFPCSNCEKCGEHIDNKFDVDASLTARWLRCSSGKCTDGCSSRGSQERCPYHQRYSEGSAIEGFYVSDLLSIGESSDHNQKLRYDFIGCHEEETKLFITQKVSGIMGFSHRKNHGESSLMDSLLAVADKDLFAMCLAEEGGLLTVGWFDPSLHLKDRNGSYQVKWTEILGTVNYRIGLTGLTLFRKTLGSTERDFGSAVVDSGTTYTYFPADIYRDLKQTMSDLCTPEFACKFSNETLPCWFIPDMHDFPSFLPTMTMKLRGRLEIEWRPQSYLYYRDDNYWCLGIDEDTSSNTVLGMTFLKGKQVIFNRASNRIGFVEADCPTYRLADRPPDNRPSADPYFRYFKPGGEPGDGGPEETAKWWAIMVITVGAATSAMLVIACQTVRFSIQRNPVAYRRWRDDESGFDQGSELYPQEEVTSQGARIETTPPINEDVSDDDARQLEPFNQSSGSDEFSSHSEYTESSSSDGEDVSGDIPPAQLVLKNCA